MIIFCKKTIGLFLCVAFLSVLSCSDDTETSDNAGTDNETGEGSDFTTADWSEATHSNDVDPNYDVVFPQDAVNTLEITMTANDWSNIQSNMKSLFGFAFGSGGQGNGGGGGGGGGFPDEEPDYVAVSLKSNGIEWYKVGFRLKGNSSLSSSWRSGTYKLPFRLNFDAFEDDYPQIKNQRFYGFKEFSMSPGYNDNSLIREKAVSDIFRMAGIPSARTAFYKVYIDFGSGLKYCGVYTMIEVIDDTMVKDQFGEDDGNIYKPESTFQTFSSSEFEKKNNEEENDFSDVQAAITALNSSIRTSNAAQWRTNLEANFNVYHFTKWLAVNTTLVNWDTYGGMAHNHYLYNHSEDKLTWIPWDNNEALKNQSGNNRSSVTLSLSSVSSQWPLIRYIADDATYYAAYKGYVRAFADDVFTSEKMDELFTRYHDLISPYVIGPEETESGKYTQLSSSSSFTSELSSLKQHVADRQAAVKSFLP